MKRTRLALGMLVTLMLAVGAIAAGPSVAFAAEGANLAMGTGAALQTQATSYGVWVGGKQVTSANANNVLGDGRVSYNAKTNTLTLKNAKITNGDTWYNNGRSFRAAIDAEGSNTLTIQLVGTNTVKTPYSSAVDTSMGISCDGLVIKGSGKLTVSGAKAQRNSVGVLANKLTVKGSAKLDAKGASVSRVRHRRHKQDDGLRQGPGDRIGNESRVLRLRRLGNTDIRQRLHAVREGRRQLEVDRRQAEEARQ